MVLTRIKSGLKSKIWLVMFIDNECNEDNVLCCRVPVNVRDNVDFLYSEEHKDIYPVVLRFVQFMIAKRGWFIPSTVQYQQNVYKLRLREI